MATHSPRILAFFPEIIWVLFANTLIFASIFIPNKSQNHRLASPVLFFGRATVVMPESSRYRSSGGEILGPPLRDRPPEHNYVGR